MRSTVVAFCALAATVACLATSAAGAAAGTGEPISGFATVYGSRRNGGDPNKPVNGLLNGACGYGEFARNEWPNWQVAAIGPGNPIAQSGRPQKFGCGACIEVTCNSTACRGDGVLTVLVTDQCKSCKPQEININALAFEQHLSDITGALDVVWRQVPCRPPGNIVAKVQDASGSFIRFVLLQVAGESGFSQVDIRGNGQSSWTVPNGDWGTQLQTSSAGSASYDLRLTPRDGSPPIIARNAIPTAARGSYDIGVQLPAGPLPPTLLAPQPQPTVAPGPSANNTVISPAPAAVLVQPIANTTAAGGSAQKITPLPANGTLAGVRPAISTAVAPTPGASAPVAAAAATSQRNPFLPFQAVPTAALNATPGDYIINANSPPGNTTLAPVPANATQPAQPVAQAIPAVAAGAPVQAAAPSPAPVQPPRAAPATAPIVAPTLAPILAPVVPPVPPAQPPQALAAAVAAREQASPPVLPPAQPSLAPAAAPLVAPVSAPVPDPVQAAQQPAAPVVAPAAATQAGAVPLVVPPAQPPSVPPATVPTTAPSLAPSAGVTTLPFVYPASGEAPAPAAPATVSVPAPVQAQPAAEVPSRSLVPSQSAQPAAATQVPAPAPARGMVSSYSLPPQSTAAAPVPQPADTSSVISTVAVASSSQPPLIAAPAYAPALSPTDTSSRVSGKAASFGAIPYSGNPLSAPPALPPAAVPASSSASSPVAAPVLEQQGVSSAAPPVQPLEASSGQAAAVAAEPQTGQNAAAVPAAAGPDSMSLALDRSNVNVTGSSANAPAIDAEVQRILNPRVAYAAAG